MRFKIQLSLIVALLFCVNIHAQELAQFKDGQTVCFIGNSITQAGTYHMLVQAYYATRFPGNKVKFISCGVSGDNAAGMIERFDTDVLIHKPDYAFLMTGMNDMLGDLYPNYLKVDADIIAKRANVLKNYSKLTEKLVEMLLANNIKPILMTPSIYDETVASSTPVNTGKNDALELCAKHIRHLGEKYQVPVVDLNPFMLQINQQEQKKNPTFTLTGKDRVHPEETGHFVMAYKIINTLFPTKDISDLRVDAKNRKILNSYNCEANFEKNTKQISFTVKANALPFPINKEFVEAQRLVPFSNYNKEMLQIQGIKKGRYVLQINNNAVDTLSANALEAGINLATNKLTPQYKQAERVFELCLKYNEIQAKLRIIVLVPFRLLKGYTGPKTFEAQKAFLAMNLEKSEGKSWYAYNKMVCEKYFEYQPLEAELWNNLDQIRNEIYSSNIPAIHNYKLIKL